MTRGVCIQWGVCIQGGLHLGKVCLRGGLHPGVGGRADLPSSDTTGYGQLECIIVASNVAFYLSQTFLAVLDGTNGEPMNPYMITSKAVANVIVSIVTGNRNDYDDADFHQFIQESHEAVATVSNSGILVALPFLRSVTISFSLWTLFCQIWQYCVDYGYKFRWT